MAHPACGTPMRTDRSSELVVREECHQRSAREEIRVEEMKALIRESIRDLDDEDAVPGEHAQDLFEKPLRINHVLKDMRQQDEVELSPLLRKACERGFF